MSENHQEERNEEPILQWVLRYIFIPISVAIIAGLFALEVIDREVASRAPDGDIQATQIHSVVGTLSAATATPQLEAEGTRDVTQIITSEVEVTVMVTITPIEVDDETANLTRCGQVPPGWRIYIVQWGDTFYSLARNSGTSIDAIRQANCLFGILKAGTRIWLPTVVVDTPAEIVIVPSPTPPPTPSATPVVTDHLPTAFITSPPNGAQLVANHVEKNLWYAEVVLDGSGTDLEDGTLPASTFVWTTNRTEIQAANLGGGPHIVARLYTVGCERVEHTLQLMVTDSAGNVGEDKITAVVYREC